MTLAIIPFGEILAWAAKGYVVVSDMRPSPGAHYSVLMQWRPR